MTDCVQRLLNTKTYPQRTPEWYAIRNTLITASDAAAALDIRPYEGFRGSPRADLLKKKSNPQAVPYTSSIVMHGVQYEDEARQVYCERTGEEVFELGLCVHPELPWIGASPDGVTTTGKLVEIKCPVTREVVPGHVPEHYMPQLQVCMEVLDLDEAVFIQYKPESLTWPKPMVYDVTLVPRDREWFARHRDALHQFWKDMTDLQSQNKVTEETVVVTTPRQRPQRSCLILDDLYTDEGSMS